MTLKELNEKIREAIAGDADDIGVFVVGNELRCWSVEYPEEGHIAIPFPQKRKGPPLERDTLKDRLWKLTKNRDPHVALAAIREYHNAFGNKGTK